MACSLTLNGRELPCSKTVGGLKTIYFAEYDGTMTTSTAGTADWYQFDLKGASSLETAINGSRENNSIFYTQTVNVQLPLLDSATSDEIKLLAANNIFRYIRKGEVVAMTKLNNMNAELLEFVVNSKSKITNKLIKDLDFPRSAIIGGVIRNGKGIIPLGNFRIEAGDRVVVCCLPRSITEVEKFFF